jgi:carboxyvinyl-carboxyphosphonate phosphorylmutase
MRKTQQLRALLQAPEFLVVPGAYDGVSARLIEKKGFRALYMTGYGVAASALGLPDVGYATLTEMRERARAIASSVAIPLIADADTGFGNAMNVRRTVREYEQAGVAGIQIEDQVSPKRCGHMMGRQIIPLEEMVQKIKAAVDARLDPDFVIVARTDARTSLGLEDALQRSEAYRDAGADVLFVESPETEQEMFEIGQRLKGTPLLSNQVEGGRTPLRSASELKNMGFGLAIFPSGALYSATKAIGDYLDELVRSGGSANFMDRVVPFSEFNDLIGLPEHVAVESRYSLDKPEILVG